MKKLLAAVLAGLAVFAGLTFAQNTPFRIMPEMQRGFPSYIRAMPTYIDARVLAANVSETHTVPGGGTNTVLLPTVRSITLSQEQARRFLLLT